MKSPVTILAALLILCAAGSCSKDKDNANEGTVLKRYKTIFRDTIVFHYIYDRDASGKLIAMRDSTRAYEFTTKLEYGSNGKVTKANFIQVGSVVAYSYEFEYNSEGRISKRKIIAGALNVSDNYNVYVYDAAGHLTVDSQFVHVNSTSSVVTRVAKFQYTGDNITEAEDYDLITGMPVLYSKVKYEYDNGINPFKNLDLEYYINEAGSAIYTVILRSGNNIQRQYTGNSNGGWTLSTTCNYTYNSNNYALKSTAVNAAPNQRVDTEYYY